jgi:hypothetical protein
VEKKQRKGPKMTWLKLIAEIGIYDINWKQLGIWCSGNDITGTLSIRKDLVCRKKLII